MLLTGCVLTSMSGAYFTTLTDVGFSRSRLWWEIVLNVEILCAALVWFSFVERIKAAEGKRYYVLLAQCFVAMFATLLPVWIALAGASLGWFTKRPELAAINWLVVACLGLWAAGMALPICVQLILGRSLRLPPFFRGATPMVMVLRFSPLLLTFGLVWWQESVGGYLHYIYAPILLYAQGSLSYLMRSFRFVEDTSSA
ncbi:hypothetical protein [Kordiimonas sp.]|uniref:hypothetical protein n=1 Tax=Kordiimonas sp. TaxID=1970157 RepID=UPI003A8D3945